MPGQGAPTVYYDGACPLCAREIGFYKRQQGADRVRWVDVSRGETTDVAPDLPRAQALARLTVRDVDGRLVSGSLAFTRIWTWLPRFRWLGRFLAIPPFPLLLHHAYEIFLKTRPLLQAIASRRTAPGQRA
jgi:predicted DCC family thiol-disulfide oxidoreductase YuxK